MEDIEEMDVWCKEDTGMQKKLGGDMSGRTRHNTLERKGKLYHNSKKHLKISNKYFERRRSLVEMYREGLDTTLCSFIGSSKKKQETSHYN